MAMEMLKDRKPTVRASASAEAVPPPPPLAPPARAAGAGAGEAPSNVRCRFDPELVAGILAALVAPAAARLRVAQPTRAGARGILDVTTTSAGSCSGHRRPPPFRVSKFMLACNLCCRPLVGGGDLHMYKGEMAFCSPECRHEYSVEDLHRERRRAVRGNAKGDAGGEGSIFFICAENIL